MFLRIRLSVEIRRRSFVRSPRKFNSRPNGPKRTANKGLNLGLNAALTPVLTSSLHRRAKLSTLLTPPYLEYRQISTTESVDMQPPLPVSGLAGFPRTCAAFAPHALCAFLSVLDTGCSASGVRS